MNKIRKIIVVLLVVSNPAVLSAIAILLCSIVSPSTMIGEDRVVMAGAIIDADVVIGKHCIINMGATIDQDGVNEDYCYIAHPCKVLREN